MDSLRTCACAIIFARRKSLLFVRLTTTKQQKANLYDPVPVSSFRSFPTPVGTPGGKPQRLTASAKKGRERPYSHSLVLSVGASQTPFPQKAKKDCSTHAALFVFTVRVPVHPPGGAATQQIAPPTRAPAGRGPTDARHSRRARGHHGHRAATVRPQLKRLMLTEIEDQPRLRGVPRTRRACFAFMYR